MQKSSVNMAIEALRYYKQKYIVNSNIQDQYKANQPTFINARKKVTRIAKAIKELELVKKAWL